MRPRQLNVCQDMTHNPERKKDIMTRTLIASFAAAAMLGGFVAATTVFAQEGAPPPQSPQAQHTMSGHGGMMGMMGQMSPDHMQQMNEVFEKCDRMMTARAGSDKEHAPDHRE
jgi:hypothetical protein